MLCTSFLTLGILVSITKTLCCDQCQATYLLYSESSNLLRSVMLRFIKFDVVGEKSGQQLANLDVQSSENLLDISNVEIGGDTQKTLLDVDKAKQKMQKLEMLQFYKAVTSFLQTRLPLNDKLVRSMQCLHPEVRGEERAQKLMRELCTALPTIDDGDISRVTDEWKLYRAENIKQDQIYKEGHLVRIDHFWNYVLNLKNAGEELKYPYLRKVVHTCLCIPHGNADVERSLSVNKKLVTAERSLLSEESVNGLRLTRDAVSMYKTIADVPVTKELLRNVKQAHRRYTERVEAEKSEALLLDRKQKEADQQQEMEKKALDEEKDRKRKLDDKEKKVKKSELEMKADMEKANQMFEEANHRLSKAIKNKDFKEMNIAQGLLDVAKTNLGKITVAMNKCVDDRNAIGKKRMRMIDSFMKTKTDKK